MYMHWIRDTGHWDRPWHMTWLGKSWLWELLATLYEQMQNFNVGDVHLKPSRGHVYIRQPVTVGTFDFLIWADVECQCGCNGDIHGSYQGNVFRLGRWWPWELLTSLYEQVQNFNAVLMVAFILLYMLLFLHNLCFIFEKPAMKIKIDTYKFLKGMHTPLQVCIHSI